jgi:outer membrane lipoprotein-sorting protein
MEVCFDIMKLGVKLSDMTMMLKQFFKSNHAKKLASHLFKISFCISIFFIFIGWTDTWENIRQKSGSIESVQADFIQEKHLKILSKPLISKGRLYFKAPHSLRWEYNSPFQSVLLMHNGQINRFVKNSEGFSRDSGMKLQAMQLIMEEITLWLNGRFQDNPTFNASLEPDLKIVLIPKEKAFSAIITRIELTLSDQPGLIHMVTIFENEDSLTKLIFKDAKLNEPLNDSLFEETISNAHPS